MAMGMGRLLPREGRFFDYFNEHAGHAVLAATELKALLDDLSGLETRRRNIERHEKQADQITHHTMQLLHQTFITPLDRDEIHQLITRSEERRVGKGWRYRRWQKTAYEITV